MAVGAVVAVRRVGQRERIERGGAFGLGRVRGVEADAVEPRPVRAARDRGGPGLGDRVLPQLRGGLRAEAAGVEIADPEPIGLALLIAREAVERAIDRSAERGEAAAQIGIGGHRGEHRAPAEQVGSGTLRPELRKRVAAFEMAEFMPEHRAELGLAAGAEQQPAEHAHRPVRRHARVEQRHAQDIDPHACTARRADRVAERAADIGVERGVADQQRRQRELALVLVRLGPGADLVDADRLIGARIRRRGGGGGGEQGQGERGDGHRGAGVLPGKSASSCWTRVAAPSGVRRSPPIARSALSQSRSPVRRSTSPA